MISDIPYKEKDDLAVILGSDCDDLGNNDESQVKIKLQMIL